MQRCGHTAGFRSASRSCAVAQPVCSAVASTTRPSLLRQLNGKLPGAHQRGLLALTARPAPRSLACQAFRKGEPEVPDRVIASLPYLLPVLDALPYAKFMLLQYPFMARLLAPLAPLALLYNTIPFGPFLVFLGVYSGIVNNQSLPRFVRYNAMQAVLLDVLLIIPQVLLDNVFKPSGGGPMLQAYISTNNTIFLFVAASAIYGVGSCAVGQLPRLPLVAEAADSQVRDGPSGW